MWSRHRSCPVQESPASLRLLPLGVSAERWLTVQSFILPPPFSQGEIQILEGTKLAFIQAS